MKNTSACMRGRASKGVGGRACALNRTKSADFCVFSPFPPYFIIDFVMNP